MNLFHLSDAAPTTVTTSPTAGRDFASASQQRWTKSHNGSEIPMAEAFSGFFGRFPSCTIAYTSAEL